MRYYVGNLPYSASENDIRSFFAPFSVIDVKVITDRETGRPRGFAFVDLDNSVDSNTILSKFDGQDFGGRTVVVNIANEKPQRERGGGSRDGRDGGRDRQRRGR